MKVIDIWKEWLNSNEDKFIHPLIFKSANFRRINYTFKGVNNILVLSFNYRDTDNDNEITILVDYLTGNLRSAYCPIGRLPSSGPGR